MREWLEKIRYKPFGQFIDEEAQCITTGLDGYYYTLDIEEIESIVRLKDIDCRNNPELFKAVTAIREDSDAYQWFVTNYNSWYLCDNEYSWSLCKKAYHKATLEELQEKFKKQYV